MDKSEAALWRGLLNGMACGTVLWALIGLAVWWWLK
jgi:hypothetical protein